MPLSVSGEILDTRGEKLSNATIEIWQADHLGHYDLDGYRYRAKLSANGSSDYKFETMMPGHYPDRVCQHIHYIVSAPGHKTLVTQLYFATDPVFEGDPDKNFNRDPLVIMSRPSATNSPPLGTIPFSRKRCRGVCVAKSQIRTGAGVRELSALK